MKNFEVHLFVEKNLEYRYQLKGKEYSLFEISTSAYSIFPDVLDASLLRNINKSSSFRFRLKRYLFGDYRRIVPFSAKGCFRLLRATIHSLMPLYNNLVETYENLSQFDEETEKVLSRVSPDLLVCWAQSIEPTVMATIVTASKTKSKSVLVYDNWDNLSSKAVLVRHPNYIVCFGKQSLQFAEAVHSIEKSKIFAIGTSRFDVYQEARFNSDFHRRESVLIAGSSLAMEDEEILTTIEAYLDSNEVINELKRFKFIYRPHPKPQGKSPSFENWPYKHIRLDNYAQNNSDWQSQDGIRDLLCKQKLVIASPTTLIIEAILAGSEVIIPAFHIPKIKSSNRKMLSELEHLKILRDFVALKVVNTRNELIQQILRVLLANERKKEGNFDADFVVQMKPGSFSSRFNDLLLDLSKTSSDKYGDQSGVKIVD